MKYTKAILKIILVLITVLLMQLIPTIGLSVFYTMKALAAGVSQAELATTIQEAIYGKLDIIAAIGGVLTLIFLFILCLIRSKKFNVEYKVNKFRSNYLVYIIPMGALSFLLSISLVTIFDVTSLDTEMAETLSNLVLNGSLVVTLINVAIIVPLYEEMVFRGYVFRKLYSTMGIKVAIVIQALIFSLFHMNLVQALPTFILGILAGLAVYYTNSIWGGVIVHAVNNSLSIILSHVLPEETEITKIMAIAFIVVAVAALFFIIKIFRENRTKWIATGEEKIEEVVLES